MTKYTPQALMLDMLSEREIQHGDNVTDSASWSTQAMFLYIESLISKHLDKNILCTGCFVQATHYSVLMQRHITYTMSKIKLNKLNEQKVE